MATLGVATQSGEAQALLDDADEESVWPLLNHDTRQFRQAALPKELLTRADSAAATRSATAEVIATNRSDGGASAASPSFSTP